MYFDYIIQIMLYRPFGKEFPMNSIMQTVNEIEQAVLQGDETYNGSYNMQLYRKFITSVGYAPGEYFRRRRMSVALSRLRISQMTDAQIAYACGYSSQQAMCREIKKYLGLTAGEYRKSDELYYFPPYKGKTVHSLSVTTQTLPHLQQLFFESTGLQGMESSAVERFFAQNPHYTGRLFGRDGGQKGSRFTYVLLAESNIPINTQGFMVGESFPAFSATMAVSACPNNDEAISGAWDWLYTDWLPHSCYRYAGETTATHQTEYFEEYLYKNNRPYRLKLYLPVVRQGDFLKLQMERLDCRLLTCTKSGVDAQTRAGEQLMAYLRQQHPYLLLQTHQFYVCEKGNQCTCGVFCNEITPTIGTEGISILEYKQWDCIRLIVSGVCNPHRVDEILTDWAQDNGFEQQEDAPLFFVYHTDQSITEAVLPVKTGNLL